jgi:hypothetical protein
MRKSITTLVAVLILSASLLFIGTSASAIDPVKALTRKVNRLEGRVTRLEGDIRSMKIDVNDLLYDVFNCTFPGDPLVGFVDGSFGYVLYYDSFCTLAGTPSKPADGGLAKVQREGG